MDLFQVNMNQNTQISIWREDHDEALEIHPFGNDDQPIPFPRPSSSGPVNIHRDSDRQWGDARREEGGVARGNHGDPGLPLWLRSDAQTM